MKVLVQQVLQGKVVEEPQLFAVSGAIVVVVVVVGLVEECMVCLGQQHFENKAVAVVVVVKDSTI